MQPTSPPLAGAYILPHPGGPGAFLRQRTPTHAHRGIDLEAETGRPILAVQSGTVRSAGKVPRRGFAGYGRFVEVQLDGSPALFAFYAHLSRIDVQAGQHVEAGEIVGAVGRSQFRGGDPGDEHGPMGSHLHFELSRRPYPLPPEGSSRIDPVAFLVRNGVPRSRAAQDGDRRWDFAGVGGPPDAPLARAPRTLTPSLRAELMRRVIETDIRVNAAALMLERTPGASSFGATLRDRWTEARGVLLEALASPTPVESARAAVSDWLALVRQARELIGELPSEAAREAGRAWTEAQHALWTAGEWMIDRAERYIDEHILEPAAAAAAGAGTLLLLLLGAWIIGGGAFAAKRARATQDLPEYLEK